jgi:hypothetical protein
MPKTGEGDRVAVVVSCRRRGEGGKISFEFNDYMSLPKNLAGEPSSD